MMEDDVERRCALLNNTETCPLITTFWRDTHQISCITTKIACNLQRCHPGQLALLLVMPAPCCSSITSKAAMPQLRDEQGTQQWSKNSMPEQHAG